MKGRATGSECRRPRPRRFASRGWRLRSRLRWQTAMSPSLQHPQTVFSNNSSNMQHTSSAPEFPREESTAVEEKLMVNDPSPCAQFNPPPTHTRPVVRIRFSPVSTDIYRILSTDRFWPNPVVSVFSCGSYTCYELKSIVDHRRNVISIRAVMPIRDHQRNIFH